MTDKKLSLSECRDPTHWDDLVASSAQGSVFCRTAFLDALGVDYDLWLVLRNHETLAGAIILRHDKHVVTAPHAFTMYQGILFSESITRQPPHRRATRVLEVFECLLAELQTFYDKVSFCLHHTVADLRGLQWFHYHEPHLGQFNIGLYYTGLIDLRAWPNFEGYLASVRKTVRSEYRKAGREGLIVEVSNDIDTLDRLHKLTFERQGMERREEQARLLHAITSAALAKGFGELLICRNAHGEAASATLFLYDSKCAYYIFGANHPAHRSSKSGTFLMLENICRSQMRGLKDLDVCGINSPKRGYFKTSFNPVPVPYFVATWERPRSVTSI